MTVPKKERMIELLVAGHPLKRLIKIDSQQDEFHVAIGVDLTKVGQIKETSSIPPTVRPGYVIFKFQGQTRPCECGRHSIEQFELII